MTTQPSGTVHPLLIGYIFVFGAAALACFLSVLRARKITDKDTRRGIVALLLGSGGWAAAHIGYLLVPLPQYKVAFYQLGLVIGILTVGPWLYLCSAFTGRTLHRSSTITKFILAAFGILILIKLSNPLHGWYFQTEVVETPFPHLAIHNQILHWLTMGLAYALATVGYFMLLERFWHIGKSAVPLAILVSLTGLPVILDVLALTTPVFLDLTYEPIGVAIFAIGVLFVYLEDFETIRLTGDRNNPVIALDADDTIREFNDATAKLFPDIQVDDRIDRVLPGHAEGVTDEYIFELESTRGSRYFQVASHQFSSGSKGLGRVLTLTDVTEREQYRHRLERQNERLEKFASMISHDLRNPLTVALGRIELALEEGENEHLERTLTALNRMEELIEDLLTLAKEGQPIDETESVSLAEIANQCWAVVATDTATLSVATDLTFEADSDRLQQLLENLFRNAIEHGGTDVDIRVGAIPSENGFFVEDDGQGIPPENQAEVFEFGFSTEEDGTGFGLSIVKEIADAHGWDIRATESPDGGARFEITDVNVA